MEPNKPLPSHHHTARKSLGASYESWRIHRTLRNLAAKASPRTAGACARAKWYVPTPALDGILHLWAVEPAYRTPLDALRAAVKQCERRKRAALIRRGIDPDEVIRKRMESISGETWEPKNKGGSFSRMVKAHEANTINRR